MSWLRSFELLDPRVCACGTRRQDRCDKGIASWTSATSIERAVSLGHAFSMCSTWS